MADPALAALAGVPLFSQIPQRRLKRILELMGEYEYGDGQTILEQARQGEVLFVLLEGSARVVRGGRTVARLSPGEFFGEIAVLDRRPRTASIVATSPVRCMTLHRDDLREVLAKEPEIAWSLLEGLAGRLRGD
jgi:CRP/FNR family cyclic AMP-dependent transcriptional regulator